MTPWIFPLWWRGFVILVLGGEVAWIWRRPNFCILCPCSEDRCIWLKISDFWILVNWLLIRNVVVKLNWHQRTRVNPWFGMIDIEMTNFEKCERVIFLGCMSPPKCIFFYKDPTAFPPFWTFVSKMYDQNNDIMGTQNWKLLVREGLKKGLFL